MINKNVAVSHPKMNLANLEFLPSFLVPSTLTIYDLFRDLIMTEKPNVTKMTLSHTVCDILWQYWDRWKKIYLILSTSEHVRYGWHSFIEPILKCSCGHGLSDWLRWFGWDVVKGSNNRVTFIFGSFREFSWSFSGVSRSFVRFFVNFQIFLLDFLLLLFSESVLYRWYMQ